MVEILDSTLREGEQTPGVTFTVEEKLEIARLVDQFGVDIIEAGHPLVSSDVRRAVKKVAREGLDAEILGHSRAMRSDVDAVIDCDVDWVGMFFCLEDERLENQFRRSRDDMIDLIVDLIEYARDHGLRVRYTPEDTMRTDFHSVVQVAEAAVEAGVDRISIADTVGAATPSQMSRFVSQLKELTSAELNVHCHNDLGLATANAISAYESGAVLIDTCINGLGERCGIASLAEVTMALKVSHQVNNDWDMALLPELSALVERTSGMRVSDQEPVVGTHAFAHNAGLHVAAAVVNPSFYELYPAELLGRQRRYVVDKMAGRQTVEHILREEGLVVSQGHLDQIVAEVKTREKGEVSVDELRAMVTELGH